MADYYQGFFKPKNIKKYDGDPTKIFYRSRWELLYMSRLDTDPDVIKWSSEEHVIWYKSPKDGKMHRYFPDFIYTKKVGDLKKVYMIEIKPYRQTKPPVLTESKRKTKKYLNEVLTWAVNSAKWEAARHFCKNKNWKFEIITEKELGIKF